MKVLNTDLARQLGASTLGARLWRLGVGQASTKTPSPPPFNDTDAEQLWLVAGAPPEPANTLEMSEEDLRYMYPDGPKALPPPLGRGS